MVTLITMITIRDFWILSAERIGGPPAMLTAADLLFQATDYLNV